MVHTPLHNLTSIVLHSCIKEMVKNGEFIFKFDSTKKARFGILPRYEKDDKHIRWFELPNCFIFHNGMPSATFFLNSECILFISFIMNSRYTQGTDECIVNLKKGEKNMIFWVVLYHLSKAVWHLGRNGTDISLFMRMNY